MNATNVQIVELAKRGFSEDQIATALGMTTDTVRTVICKDSQAIKAIDDNRIHEQFTGLQEGAIATIEHLMKYSENDTVRARMAELVVKKQLGLLKPREHVTINNNLNFLLERAEKAKQLRDATVVNVNPAQ